MTKSCAHFSPPPLQRCAKGELKRANAPPLAPGALLSRRFQIVQALHDDTVVVDATELADAIQAAQAWLAGEPAAGLPYEAGADTSKIAMGGVLGQPECKDGRLRILLYWSAPLSPAQSQWHRFEQEFWGLLQLKR